MGSDTTSAPVAIPIMTRSEKCPGKRGRLSRTFVRLSSSVLASPQCPFVVELPPNAITSRPSRLRRFEDLPPPADAVLAEEEDGDVPLQVELASVRRVIPDENELRLDPVLGEVDLVRLA